MDRHDFELIQIDTNLMYMAISSEFDKIVRPELRSQYDNRGKAEFLSMSKYHDRTLGLFKAEFQGTKMIALMSNSCYAKDGKSKPKFGCKVLSKKTEFNVLALISRGT